MKKNNFFSLLSETKILGNTEGDNVTIDKPLKTVLESMLTCPNCGYHKNETMPTDACQYFYECENCKIVLKPKQGDCCVYCSYGSVKCPPIQEGQSCSKHCCS